MAIQNYIILNAAQKTAGMAFNDGLGIDPRPVDTSTPGVAINLNDNAVDYDAGAAVPLAGNFLTPTRILNDPDHIAEVPGLVGYLADKPYALIDDEMVFAPQVEDPI